MHQILHFSALAGVSWLSSNVVFVITWSWLHSRKRRWMSDDNAEPRIFKLHSDGVYTSAVTPHQSGPITGLGRVGRPVTRAS